MTRPLFKTEARYLILLAKWMANSALPWQVLTTHCVFKPTLIIYIASIPPSVVGSLETDFETRLEKYEESDTSSRTLCQKSLD